MVKVFNLISPDSAKYLHKQNFEKIYYDIINEFTKVVKIIKAGIVTNNNTGYGAEPGSIFIELLNTEEAERLITEMSGKSYEKREIEIVCVPEESYVTYYLDLLKLR